MLELGFKLELVKGVDLLGDMDMVAVGDVAFVGDALNDAEAALEALGKLIGSGFQGRAVEGEVDVAFLFPLLAGVVHVLHDGKGKGCGLGVCVALAGHVLDALIKTCVAQGDGGVAVVEQFVDGLALFQPGTGSILPQNGGNIRESSLEPFMAAHQRPVAQLQPLVKDAPELLQISAGGKGHVGEVDGYHALIEPAVVFVLAGLVVAGIGNVADACVSEPVRRQEGTTAHAGVHVALELLHLLSGDVVGHHTPGGTLGGQLGQIVVGGVLVNVVLLQHVDELGEGRGDPHAVLILDALVALLQRLLDDQGQILALLIVLGLTQVHEYRHKWCLPVGGQKRQHLILDGLDAPAHLVPQAGLHQLPDLLLRRLDAQGGHLLLHDLADLLPAHVHKGGQMGQGDGLTAVLVGGHLSDDLGGDVAGGREAVGALNEGTGDDGAVLQHVLQVHQVAVVHVLGIIVGVVEVDDAFLVGLYDVRGEQQPLAQVPGDLAGHVVPLGGVYHGVLVGVLLLGLLIAALDEAEDLLIGGIAPADQGTGVAVSDVIFGYLICSMGHDLVFHQVLNLLHRRRTVHFQTAQLHKFSNALNLHRRHAGVFLHGIVGLGDGGDDFAEIEKNFRPVSLDDFHDLQPNLS